MQKNLLANSIVALCVVIMATVNIYVALYVDNINLTNQKCECSREFFPCDSLLLIEQNRYKRIRELDSILLPTFDPKTYPEFHEK